jgi:hypothetical protein
VAQRQIPGGPLVDEVGSQQFQIPGGSFINETLSASTLTFAANTGAFDLDAPEISFDLFELTNILPAERLSITVSGNANLAHGYQITAERGTFTLSVAPSLSDVQVTAATTSYALTGFDATLTNSLRIVTAAVGTFQFLGNEVVMLAPPATPQVFPMSAETGSFAFSGKDATLIRISQTLTAETGSFELTGYTMVAASSFVVETGSFTLTGNAATFPLNEVTEWTRRSTPTTTWTRV